LDAVESLGVQLEAILLTHCHFDHIGAVAPVARATGAPVYCPQLERIVLEDVSKWVPQGFGPFESHSPEHSVEGGETLKLAGMGIEVIFTPGHSPGHVTYAFTPAGDIPADTIAGRPPGGQVALCSGDVLFAGSVGRVDLPGGDWAVLERSIGSLLRHFDGSSVVHPGHMAATTLSRELQTNPFLRELRAQLEEGARGEGATASATEAPAR
jgi:glyoxylase-like metal-dependent hydrolase (beta-lactamase superfamily II)